MNIFGFLRSDSLTKVGKNSLGSFFRPKNKLKKRYYGDTFLGVRLLPIWSVLDDYIYPPLHICFLVRYVLFSSQIPKNYFRSYFNVLGLKKTFFQNLQNLMLKFLVPLNPWLEEFSKKQSYSPFLH